MTAEPLVVAVLRCRGGRPRVDPLSGEVHADPPFGGADPDELGVLEHALLLAAALGARCLAVSSGPPQADELLREALAAGADAALRLDGPAHPGDPWRDAAAEADRLLAAVAERHGSPDLVLCAHDPQDPAADTLPAFLAARLHAAQALGLLRLGAAADAPGRLRALRRLDGGRRERLLVPLPAVCSVEPGSASPRRAALPAVLAARAQAVPVARPGRPAGVADRIRVGVPRPGSPLPQPAPYPEGATLDRLAALSGAGLPSAGPRVLTPDGPAQAAAELLDYLERHGLLTPAPGAGADR